MDSHHARLYISSHPESLARSLLGDAQNVEVVPFTEDTLAIGTVRKIIDLAYQTPGNCEHRLILITARSIAVEAQQALLKILEEPPATTRFLIILPDKASLLPTVLSRLSVMYDTNVSVATDFVDFMRMSYKERLDAIAEAAKQKNDTLFEAWYNGLVAYLEGDDRTEVDVSPHLLVLTYARARGASKKMLWEEVALTLPQTSSR